MIRGIGVDVTDLERMRRSLERTPQLEARVFTEAEIAYCRSHRDPVPSFAARFAAKEAGIKALGVGWQEGMRWTDFEVTRERDQPPVLRLHGASARMAEAQSVQKIHLSLTHGEAQAIAFVVFES